MEASIEIPEGWTPEEIRGPLTFKGDELEAACAWDYEKGRLTYRRMARLLISRIAPDRYEAFRADLSRLRAADRTAVVFVRSAAGGGARSAGTSSAPRD